MDARGHFWLNRIAMRNISDFQEVKSIQDIGYDDFFESNRKKIGLEGLPARVTAEHRGSYEVINEKGVFSAKIIGKLIFDAVGREDYPVVGDWIIISEPEAGQTLIQGILPRKTIIRRRSGDKNRAGEKTEVQIIGANIDKAFVVEAIGRDYNLNRFERYFALAGEGGVDCAIILNKIDLISGDELDAKLAELKSRFKDIEIIPTSVISKDGLDALSSHISPGRTYCFLGSSGIGKSSLINKLIGDDSIKTGKISSLSGRGRHVTTARRMYFLKNGGIVIDNPGMREVGMTDADAGIEKFFDEIIALAGNCKYADCAHISEPDCAVLAALMSGKLGRDKYENYVSLKKEAEYYGMSSLERREKARSFGKFVKSAKKELKRYKS